MAVIKNIGHPVTQNIRMKLYDIVEANNANELTALLRAGMNPALQNEYLFRRCIISKKLRLAQIVLQFHSPDIALHDYDMVSNIAGKCTIDNNSHSLLLRNLVQHHPKIMTDTAVARALAVLISQKRTSVYTNAIVALLLERLGVNRHEVIHHFSKAKASNLSVNACRWIIEHLPLDDIDTQPALAKRLINLYSDKGSINYNLIQTLPESLKPFALKLYLA